MSKRTRLLPPLQRPGLLPEAGASETADYWNACCSPEAKALSMITASSSLADSGGPKGQPWFLESRAFQPKCRIRMFIWSLGPLDSDSCSGVWQTPTPSLGRPGARLSPEPAAMHGGVLSSLRYLGSSRGQPHRKILLDKLRLLEEGLSLLLFLKSGPAIAPALEQMPTSSCMFHLHMLRRGAFFTSARSLMPNIHASVSVRGSMPVVFAAIHVQSGEPS